MDTSKFKHIVSEARAGAVASIRFFGKITEESTNQFNAEFDYLEQVIKPSLIRILINSEGGSVLYGMSTYATIQNSTIPTECINEGMAASMASILWAAGGRSWMRDYAILMIHNPCLPSDEEGEPNDLVKAFTKQIETIYRKRFGLKAEHVRAIMDGQAGKDGTFFDAGGAVKAGIIPADHIIHTSKQLRDKVQNSLAGTDNAAEIQSIMTQISAEAGAVETHFKQAESQNPNLLPIDKIKTTKMNEEKTMSAEYSAVTATLGLKDKSEVKDVMARITELVAVEAKLKETAKALTDAQTVIAGKDATIGNIQKDLDTANASLAEYQKKEADEKKANNRAMIEAAVQAGKIDRESTDHWLSLAEQNPALVKNTLDSIPAREQITKQIATDPANVQAAAEATKNAEAIMAEKVKAAVGESFEFKKIG